MSSTRNYFALGHTARGFHSLYGSAFHETQRLYILEGGYGAGKSHWMHKLATAVQERGEPVELFHSPLNPGSVDGIIINGGKTGVVDGSAYRGAAITAPGVREIYVNLWPALQTSDLTAYKKDISELNAGITEGYEQAFDIFAEALSVHDQWEKFYIQNMDFKKADQVADNLADAWFTGHKKNKPSHVRRRFFGAATPDGAVDHIQSLTQEVNKRYFLKGRPGSGKSTMLKKLSASAQSLGIDVDVFHCGFDPNSLDMLIFPELSIAVFDSTAPHEYFPHRSSDEIVDLYELLIAPGTDEKHQAQLKEIRQVYSAKMKAATACLRKVREYNQQLKSIYVNHTDYQAVEHITSQLEQRIL
ncbi:PRK06851 family protein [Paenibacillus xerothermodurans]|uniref:ATPase n=1 Tax=Paenibacillus xerothermodurans TaxID=1977292 RepID=A0A2W1NRL8_PAEXE|nr:PRK06851 family protein [Paenibacillus xerothermodurans]PZE20386.1 hypothetical protein CBW46_013175 [Paenibacillus xerothermodurans]